MSAAHPLNPPREAGIGSFRLPRSSRIYRGAEIKTLLRRGKKKRTANLDVFLSTSPVSRSRWGMIVPKHGHQIVDRNRLKRRLREVGRTEVLPRLRAAGLEMDVLVRARTEAYGAGFNRLREELLSITEELCSSG